MCVCVSINNFKKAAKRLPSLKLRWHMQHLNILVYAWIFQGCKICPQKKPTKTQSFLPNLDDPVLAYDKLNC